MSIPPPANGASGTSTYSVSRPDSASVRNRNPLASVREFSTDNPRLTRASAFASTVGVAKTGASEGGAGDGGAGAWAEAAMGHRTANIANARTRSITLLRRWLSGKGLRRAPGVRAVNVQRSHARIAALSTVSIRARLAAHPAGDAELASRLFLSLVSKQRAILVTIRTCGADFGRVLLKYP